MGKRERGITGLILLAFRHGMRISELLDLHYRDLDLVEGRINIRRLKNGFSTVHPLMIDECDAIRCWSQLRAAWKGAQKTDALFISRRGTPAFPSTSLPNYPNRRHRRRDGNAYSPAYAAPCLRLRAGGERSGYPPYPGLPRPSKHSPYRTLYGQQRRAICRTLGTP
ncbi:type 1 fimbriae regulatory protein FimE [Klebsiella grimontii]|uniref:Type 1 fimbriae regulatory protein FimE n=1 Tax=Klebsiella grimontii TaxID=2058152 RepID=A0A7H4NXC2_9ENTR|nr:type 1 fimbriae regulatory protein FimE [Klebsiella grimontii]